MILAGGAGSRLSVLTQKRTKPAVPFAGKYRIIDFTLSNCVNSGIFTVGVCTQYRPRSLHDHIRSGRPWDLDRATGGITVLQPYVGRRDADWYQGTADAIYQNLDFIHRQRADVVLILAGDHIYKMNYDVLVTFHREYAADLTVATIRVPSDKASRYGILETDSSYGVRGFEEKPAQPKGQLASMGIYAFNPEVLRDILLADHNDPESCHDFGSDIIPKMLGRYRVMAFPFNGYWVDVGAIDSYWLAQMNLLEDKPELDLRDREWIIHTRSEERPPAAIRNNACVQSSLITDGCIVEGAVEHSVLSAGVIVQPGAIIRHSVVMTDTIIESGAIVDHAILDKRVRVSSGAHIGWEPTPTSAPSHSHPYGLTVIGKNTIIPVSMTIGRNCTIAADFDGSMMGTDSISNGSVIGL